MRILKINKKKNLINQKKMNYLIYILEVIYLKKNIYLISNQMKKKIILVHGDPNSINSELIFKVMEKNKYQYKKNYILYLTIIIKRSI